MGNDLSNGRRRTAPALLVLIRHAMPIATATRPPSLWPLAPVGRAASTALGGRLPDRVVWLSSTNERRLKR